ncbi:MAG TPA: isochorismatase [Bryobacteraceae bacterium]|nr:isochorismatase [Bryobacteraceae bacterium]
MTFARSGSVYVDRISRVLNHRLLAFVLALAAIALSAGFYAGPDGTRDFVLTLRSRVQPFKCCDNWEPVTVQGKFPVSGSAIIVCDMWDKHWCRGANDRVAELARRMNPFLVQARAAGLLTIHAPSETMDFYKNYPQRQFVLALPQAELPVELKLNDPPLPIDDSDGGCDTQGDHEHRVWSRENAALTIGPADAISDNGKEIYSLLQAKGIHNLFLMGVHANMCILNRSFAIRQMSRWGVHCVLVRDLTDAMYNPQKRPFVTHAAGTELVIEHIEKYWCPSTLSSDLLAALQRAHPATP